VSLLLRVSGVAGCSKVGYNLSRQVDCIGFGWDSANWVAACLEGVMT